MAECSRHAVKHDNISRCAHLGCEEIYEIRCPSGEVVIAFHAHPPEYAGGFSAVLASGNWEHAERRLLAGTLYEGRER